MSSSSSSSPPSSTNFDRYLVLVEFVYKHLDFQMAELESVLDMHGIVLGGPDCRVLTLPNASSDSSTLPTATATTTTTTSNNNDLSSYKHQRPFVILSFPAENAERLATNEFMSKWDYNQNKNNNSNSSKKNSSSSNSQGKLSSSPSTSLGGIGEILNRCTLIRSVVELWGYAADIDSCAQMAKDWTTNDSSSRVGQTLFRKVSDDTKSWKLTVHTLGTTFSREEQDDMRKKFSYLGFKGPVKMEGYDNEFILIREVEMDSNGSPLFPRHYKKQIIPENDARPPLGVYFGRVIDGLRKGRNGLDQYNLKNRKYLGPTSMDAELSFVMTSLGQVQKGSIVYDPFVGTGSILLSCGLRGAYCIGSDIDIRVLKGKGENANIWKNFEQYNLQRPEILRTDNAIYHRHYRNHKPLYDAIICDPPYGIRAGARKTGSKKENPTPILDEHRHDHIPQTMPYPVSDVMSDLLDMAARSLVPGGRLVYVIPSFADFDPRTDLPRHDCLELVHSCYQPFSSELGRRIVAMKKVSEYDASLREKYLEHIWVNGKESAEKCANLRDKIWENAKKKPGYEEKAAIRKQKRKEHKLAKKTAKRAKLAATESS